ncbi:MAG: DNA polymerase III subunit chi [Legionellales bacterium RIFCSPHIGHO2_12_FULL_42_9]|nr:MAG: DNA polymerase III subunit chi [Legionellales bacterium RIFCSPHIGHO2_12_FULL_42_9]
MSSIRVDFYLLQVNTGQEEPDLENVSQATAINTKALFACRLIEKAYLRGHQLFVYCNNKHDAETLDELLWTFKEDSFIPHNLQGEGPENPPPIQLGYEREPSGFSEILLNFSDIIPAFYNRFQRVMEIVPNEEQAKELSRLHYKEYRANGCVLKTHPI